MSNRYGPRIVTDGLVLCLDAADRNSYPGSGTSWGDLSGNSNGCTLTNGPTFSSDKNGLIDLDGTNDYFVGTNNSSLQFTGDFTIAAFVKPDNAGNESQGIFEKMRYSLYNGYGISRQSNQFKFWTASNNSGAYAATSTYTFSGNDWYYVLGKRISGTNYLYVNAEYKNSASPPFSDSGQEYVIGRYYSNLNGYYFDGSIAYVQAYNRALSDNEITQNYKAIKGRFGL